jgi:uncharacterized repeat protein (TIGR03803 family)
MTYAESHMNPIITLFSTVLSLTLAGGCISCLSAPSYQFLLRMDDLNGLDLASFENAAFLATRGGPNTVDDENTAEIYRLDTTNAYAEPITSFPRNPSGIKALQITFPDFTIAGLQNLLSPADVDGTYESIYANRGSGPTGGGTFTIGKSDFKDFNPPVPADPIAYEWPLVFCQIPYRGGPGTAIYTVLEETNNQARQICGLSHLVIGGALDVFNGRVVLLTAPLGQSSEPAQLVLFDLRTENCQVVYEFADAGDGPYVSIANDLTPDGFVYGTLANSQNGSSYVWRMHSDGTGFQQIYTFSQTYVQPMSAALGTDGYLYGVTYAGGTESRGTIFRLKPDGSDFSVRWDFRRVESKGAFPIRILRDAQAHEVALLVVARDDDGSGFFDSPAPCGRCYTVGEYREVDAASIPRPSLQIVRNGNQTPTVWLYGEDHTYYRVDVSSDLKNWSSLGSALPGPFGVPINDPKAAAGPRYYRAWR